MNDGVREMIRLLSEECGWPIDPDMVSRSAWKLEHDELGLNEDVHLGVEVYELRPLVANQPWGVFFLSVDGEDRLSVTLLRRLLRGLVKKKRATAETASRKLWDLEDLMFVCSLDEPDNSTRYFAHFRDTGEGLPKLMIGARWEDAQNPAEIDREVQKLRKNLHWPDDDSNLEAWKEQWSAGFLVRHREVITTSVLLSKELARFATRINMAIREIHRIETVNGPIHQLHSAFREGLIEGLDTIDFADMVAQTITYGLFCAKATGAELLGIETFAKSIPSTNPFLRNILLEFSSFAGDGPADLDFDDLSLDDLVSMLNSVNIDAVIGDFGNQFRGGKEDPVIHFYESFLAEYDQERRVERGVFYTPKPVVDFIVKSVHRRLIDEFELPLGLADTSTHVVNGTDWPIVMILDPATGTGTFLEATIDVIHQTMIEYWLDKGHSRTELIDLWNKYVPEHLLPRLYGFELMMAPYSIAHLKIGLKLTMTGYDFKGNQRLNVFLTDSLQQPGGLMEYLPDFLTQEAEGANLVKTILPISVIIGNPPYSGESINKGDWITDLMRGELGDGAGSYFEVDGEPLQERNLKWINDDYVKFIRVAQWFISKVEKGILGFITNHTFIRNPTFRGMRNSLTQSFNRIQIIDLNGNSREKDMIPEGVADQNVFDIVQGVAISIMEKGTDNGISNIRFTPVFGKRNEKYALLRSVGIDDIEYESVQISAPNYYFFPRNMELDAEYSQFPPITSLFPIQGMGITTARDHFAIDIDRENLVSRVVNYANFRGSSKDACASFNLSLKKGWDYDKAINDLRGLREPTKYAKKIAFRPFDTRWIFFHDGAVWRTVRQLMEEMQRDGNIGFCFTRRSRDGSTNTFLAVRHVVDKAVLGTLDNANVAPMFVSKSGAPDLIPNIHQQLLPELAARFESEPDHIDFFHYAYAIVHSNSFRERYATQIAMDFPRIPITVDEELFHELVQLGANLVALHLLEADYEYASWNHGDEEVPFEKESFIQLSSGNNIVGKVTGKSWKEGELWINSSQYISGIEPLLVEYKIGNYPILLRWLKTRENRQLSEEDVCHFRMMCQSLTETLELMDRIDSSIESHGSWPLSGSEIQILTVPPVDPKQKSLFDY